MREFSVPELSIKKVPGGTISYREAGCGEAIIFFHGINIHSGIWGYQFPFFSSRYRVIAWDAPSYRKSTPREGRVEVYAAGLAALLDALAIEKARIVGHSMGGIVGGAFVGKYSDRVHSIVFSCTHTGVARPIGEPLAERYQIRIKERAKVTPMGYGRLQAEKMTTDGTSVVSQTSAEHFPINAAMCQHADNRSRLPAYKKPALILHGGADRLGPSEGHKRLLDTMPTAEKLVFPNLGHSPYLEDPESYNSSLDSFFIIISDQADFHYPAVLFLISDPWPDNY